MDSEVYGLNICSWWEKFSWSVTHARSTKAAKRQRRSCEYALDHRNVRKRKPFVSSTMFTLSSLRMNIVDNGPVPRQQSTKGRTAHNAYPFKVVISTVEFIRNYSDVFSLTQPAASCSRANQAPTYLPAHQITKSYIKSTKMRVQRKIGLTYSTGAFLICGISASLTLCSWLLELRCASLVKIITLLYSVLLPQMKRKGFRRIFTTPVKFDDFSVEDLPLLLTPAGLFHDWVHYLFKEVRSFVHLEYRDVLSPSPTEN